MLIDIQKSSEDYKNTEHGLTLHASIVLGVKTPFKHNLGLECQPIPVYCWFAALHKWFR